MKKIFLLLCIISVSAMHVFAQAATTIPASVRTDFKNRVNQLNIFLAQNKVEEAWAAWNDVRTTINAEFVISEQIYDEIEKNGSKDDAKNMSEKMMRQSILFCKMQSLNMLTQQAEFNKLLEEFDSNTL